VPKQKETCFKERAMRDLKKLKKCWFVKTQMVAKRGIPDLLLCINGWFLAIELKIPGEDGSPLQKWNLESIALAGGMGFIVDETAWDNLFEFLKELDTCETAHDNIHANIKKSKTEH
jgi:hypothetical protein